jgi:hypothetical protein
MEQWWNDAGKRKLKDLEKNLSEWHLVYQNPTWIAMGAHLVFHSEKPVTNHPY